MRDWVLAAKDWSVAAQTMVETSTALATHSRDLADRLAPAPDPERGVTALPVDLRRLADAVEADSVELRDRYLSTAAGIKDFKDILD